MAVAALLDSRTRRVTVLAPDGVRVPLARSPRIDVHPGARPVRIDGANRVSSVEAVTSSGERVRYACDAVVLAHGRLPYRNIDGAIDNGPGVAFAQLGTAGTGDGTTEAAGRAAAELVLGRIGQTRTLQEPPLRIGGPHESNIARR